jgi:putative addiction module component (TIGR02574 family)
MIHSVAAYGSVVASYSSLVTPHSEIVMSSTVEALEAEALQLSAEERGRLIERLIASLDVDPGVDDAWAAEVERRNAQIESGAVSLIPGPEALAKLKTEFR